MSCGVVQKSYYLIYQESRLMANIDDEYKTAPNTDTPIAQYYGNVDAPPIQFDPTVDGPLLDTQDDTHHCEKKNQTWLKSFGEYKKAGCIVQIIACIVLGFNAVIHFFGYRIYKDEYAQFDNLSIYDQAADDWDALPWVDFAWGSNGQCSEGYEPIGALWNGTVLGTLKADGTPEPSIISDPKYAYFNATDPIMQVMLYSDMKDALCGKRGSHSLLDATLG